MNDPLIECSSNPSDADVAAVVAGLEAANNAVGPPERWERLFLLIRDGRGCDNAYLDTFDFQALSFYEGLGYKVYGALRDLPAGHSRYFLEKRGLGGES